MKWRVFPDLRTTRGDLWEDQGCSEVEESQVVGQN